MHLGLRRTGDRILRIAAPRPLRPRLVERALGDTGPIRRRAVGVDARLLLLGSRLLPGPCSSGSPARPSGSPVPVLSVTTLGATPASLPTSPRPPRSKLRNDRKLGTTCPIAPPCVTRRDCSSTASSSRVSAGTFENVNPATEEVIGRSPTRRRPTCTGPSAPPGAPSTRPPGRPTGRSGSSACCSCTGRARGRAGGAPRGADPRGRLPADGHPRPPARRAPRRRPQPTRPTYRPLRLGGGPGRRDGRPHRHDDQPEGVARAGGRRRRHRAVELPLRGRRSTSSARRSPPATPSCSSRRPTRRSTPRGIGRLVAEQTDIPPGVLNVVTSSDHLVGEELTLYPTRSISSRSPARPPWASGSWRRARPR